jgi:hypothetical protein
LLHLLGGLDVTDAGAITVAGRRDVIEAGDAGVEIHALTPGGMITRARPAGRALQVDHRVAIRVDGGPRIPEASAPLAEHRKQLTLQQ